MQELVEKVIAWGEEKGILTNSTPEMQLTKTMEEVVEYIQADIRGDREEAIDAIGDILVTLILFGELINIDNDDIIRVMSLKGIEDSEHLMNVIPQSEVIKRFPYEDISAQLLNTLADLRDCTSIPLTEERHLGIEEKVVVWALVYVMRVSIELAANKYEVTPHAALETAYNVIAKRTGKMVDGLFQKD